MSVNKKVFAVFATLAFLYLTSSLILPILMGGVLAVLLTPALNWVQKRKVSSQIGAAFLTLLITVVLILPTAVLVFFATKLGFSQLQSWRQSQLSGRELVDQFLTIPGVHQLLVGLSKYIPLNLDELSASLQDFAGTIGTRLTELFGGVLTHLPGIAVSLFIMVLSIYFFLVDGDKIIRFVRLNRVFSMDETDQLIDTLGDMCRSVILAAIVSGVVQAILEVLACAVTGTPNVAFIGFLVFVGSFIPLVGSFPITMGVALQQLLEGRQAVGITLAVMSLVIAGADNTIRPLFLRGAANLHPFLAFIAAFGGLQTIGFSGVFLGPIVASLCVVTLQILGRSR
jgi:predicted PurR-regulated permease PerM